jgi:hypothetical protein
VQRLLTAVSAGFTEDKILNNPEIDFIFTTNWFAVSHNLASFHILKARGRGLSLSKIRIVEITCAVN